MLLILALLLQAPNTSMDERIAAFLKGDAEARKAILKLGVAAIRPLGEARDKAPEKIDELVYELKKSIAHPRRSAAAGSLDVKCRVQLKGQKPAELAAYLQEFAGTPLVCDRFAPADLKAPSADIVFESDVPVWQALDKLCRQTGLDYGFFHNVVVIAKPDRLWPGEKTAPAFGAPAAEGQHKGPDEEKLVAALRRTKVNLDFQGSGARDIAGYLKEICSVKYEVEDPAAKPIPIFRVKDLGAFDVTALMTQILDLDFVVKEGKVLIAPRAEIHKKLGEKK